MKEKSYMVAVPKNEESINELGDMLTRLSKSEEIKMLSHDFDEVLELKLEIEGMEYEVEIVPYGYEIPEMFRINHFFPGFGY